MEHLARWRHLFDHSADRRMLTADAVEATLDKFRPLIARDGGRLELVEHREDEAIVRYTRGSNPECESCVLSQEDLGEMILEALPAGQAGFRIVMTGPVEPT